MSEKHIPVSELLAKQKTDEVPIDEVSAKETTEVSIDETPGKDTVAKENSPSEPLKSFEPLPRMTKQTKKSKRKQSQAMPSVKSAQRVASESVEHESEPTPHESEPLPHESEPLPQQGLEESSWLKSESKPEPPQMPEEPVAPEPVAEPAPSEKSEPQPIPFEDEAHPVVLIQNLQKKFGKRDALLGVHLAVLEGHVLGVVGTNGAGKTTLLRILAGLIKPTAGRVEIDGVTPGTQTKAMVSYLPDHSFLPDDFKWKKARKEFAKTYRDFDADRFDALSERLQLPKTEKVKDLSKGMKKRLEIALVLSRRARLYLLDEPLSDIDPVTQETLFDVIVETLGEHATMVIVTHQIREMERLFDEVCFLDQGQVVRYGAAEQIRTEEGADIDTVCRRTFRTEQP